MTTWLGGPGRLRAGETHKVSAAPSSTPQPTCTFLQPQPKTLCSPTAGPVAPHTSAHPLPTRTPSDGSALQPPAQRSLPHGEAGPRTRHLQGTRSAHCQPRGAPRDCLFILTFWGQESYFWLFQRQRFHHSLSASAGGRYALPGGAAAGSFVLGCGAQHQLRTTGASSSSPPASPVPRANRPRNRWEKTSLGSHAGMRVRSIPPGGGAGGRHRAEPGDRAPSRDLPSISKMSIPHTFVRHPQKRAHRAPLTWSPQALLIGISVPGNYSGGRVQPPSARPAERLRNKYVNNQISILCLSSREDFQV